MVIGHDVAIIADDHARAIAYYGLATASAIAWVSAEEELEGIHHLLLLHTLLLLHLDVHHSLDRRLRRWGKVRSRPHGALSEGEGCIVEAVFLGREPNLRPSYLRGSPTRGSTTCYHMYRRSGGYDTHSHQSEGGCHILPYFAHFDTSYMSVIILLQEGCKVCPHEQSCLYNVPLCS